MATEPVVLASLEVSYTDHRVLSVADFTHDNRMADLVVGDRWESFCMDPVPTRETTKTVIRLGDANHSRVFAATVQHAKRDGDTEVIALKVHDLMLTDVSLTFEVDEQLRLQSVSSGVWALFSVPSTTTDLKGLLAACYQLDVTPWLDLLPNINQGSNQTLLRVLPANMGIRRLTVTTRRDATSGNLLVSASPLVDGDARLVNETLSTEHFFSVVRSSVSAIVVYEVDNGTIMNVNQAALDILGLSCVDLRGSTDLVLWQSMDDRAQWVSTFGSANQVDDYKLTWQSADGQPVNLLVSARHLSFDGVHACLMHLVLVAEPETSIFRAPLLASAANPFLVHDYADSQVDSAELVSEVGDSGFSTVFSASPMPILVTHRGSGDTGAGSSIVKANGAAEALFGWPVFELEQMFTSQLFGPDDKEIHRVVHEQTVNGSLTGFVSNVVTTNGTNIPVAIYTRIFKLNGTAHGLWQFVDLSEQKTVENELRSTLGRLQQAQEIGKIGDFRWNAKTQLMHASAEANRIMGFPESEAARVENLPKTVGLDQSEFQQFLEASAVKENSEFNYQFTRQDGDGEMFYSVHGIVVEKADGIWVVGTVQDVTAEQRAQKQRAELEAKFQESQRLESLGILAGGVAHDFNNLLVGIAGNTDLALLENNLPVRAREHLNNVMQASQRAADLTRQLLAYSGKGRFVVEKANLNEVVSEMARLLEVSTSKNGVLRFDLAALLPVIECDLTQIRQVIMNLIINASESIEDNQGIVTITTGSQHCTADYLRSTHVSAEIPEGEYVFIEVTDNGTGMDAATMARIFEPFYSTKFAGRGLGLAAVLGIIKGHGGTLKIYSEVGRGTSMKMLLPAVSGTVSKPVLDTDADNWQGTGAALVIDDEPFVSDFVISVLKPRGFEVMTAEDGKAGLEIFRSRADDITVVILDLTMPNMDGEQCFWELRQIKPDVKVVLTSGYNEQEATSRFVGKGLSGFVAKPFLVSDLLKAVKAAIS